jgi:tetratricopeptide (TPR) repeat protein
MKLAIALGLLAVLSTGCPDKDRNESIQYLNQCVGAHSRKEYDDAINACEKATELWKGNHSAFYAMGDAYAKRNNWKEAADSFEKAVRIKDSEPMYHQVYGIALYNKEIQQARQALAAREGKKENEVAGQVNLAVLNFELAIQHLQRATKIEPALWNSHYHLGRIFRDTDRPAEAAQELTLAIQANPYESEPYVALAEIYRQWDYPDQAIQVATIGTNYVPGANERSKVWYQVGMGYNEKKMDDKAVEAFGQAIEDRRDNHPAKFQRGQAHFRKGDCIKAKKDLEEFAKSGSSSDQLAKQQANKMLMECAAKQM